MCYLGCRLDPTRRIAATDLVAREAVGGHVGIRLHSWVERHVAKGAADRQLSVHAHRLLRHHQAAARGNDARLLRL